MMMEGTEVQELTHVKGNPVKNAESEKVQTNDRYAPHFSEDMYRSMLRPKPAAKSNSQHDEEEKAVTRHIQPAVLKFLMVVTAGLTVLMARNYTGQYQEFINGPLTGAMYVIFGSLAISFLMFWLSPKKAVLYALSLLAVTQFFHFISIAINAEPVIRLFSAGIFGTSFAAADMAAYILGAVVAYVILWMIKSEETEPRTEVY